MKTSLVPRLRSPVDGSEFRLEERQARDGEVIEGTLVDGSGNTFPVRNGLPLFAEADSDDPTFAYKWSILGRYGHEGGSKRIRRDWYLDRFGYGSEEKLAEAIKGQNVLDAGCGSGVDTSMFADCGAEVVAVDLAQPAAASTYERLGDRPNVHVLQADIRNLPFAPGSFDYVSSDQVLHHTPDTYESLAAVRKLATDGGRLAAYVYKRKGPIREFSDDFIRQHTTTMPADECMEFCRTVTELGRALTNVHAKVDVPEAIPLLGIEAGTQDVQRFFYWNVMKAFWNEEFDYELNVLVNFDWYHPRFAYRHTPDEVRAWFGELGLDLERLDIGDAGISAIGRA
jgi:SAM-dependent methyltransferase